MNQYLVHFEDESPAFLCFADGIAHAYDQAINAYPNKIPYSIFILKLVWHVNDDEEAIVSWPVSDPNASWNLPK